MSNLGQIDVGTTHELFPDIAAKSVTSHVVDFKIPSHDAGGKFMCKEKEGKIACAGFA